MFGNGKKYLCIYFIDEIIFLQNLNKNISWWFSLIELLLHTHAYTWIDSMIYVYLWLFCITILYDNITLFKIFNICHVYIPVYIYKIAFV